MPRVAKNLIRPIGSIILFGALATILSCNDSSNPSEAVTRDPGALEPLPLDPAAPALAADSVSFYARYDQDRSVEMFFADSLGQPRGGRLLRFEVDKKSLSRYPDGSRFGGQDSVLITIRVIGTGSLAFDFQPSGLRFDPGNQAELEVNYGHALLGLPSGFSNLDEGDLAIWMQENATQPYLRLNSSVNILAREVEADVGGFSKYAVAY
jgi:hypothetical protein